jgi:hypothetical protein
VRIGDAVEHQQQRRLGEIFQHVIERLMRNASGDDGDHALMLVVSSQRFQSSVVDSVHRDPGSLGALDQLAHATIVARVSNLEAEHTLRLRAQSSNDGMESEKMARIGHEGVMRGVGAPD